MSAPAWIAVGACALAAAWLAWKFAVAPAIDLRKTLAELARGGDTTHLPRRIPKIFAGTSSDIEAVRDRLQKQSRQIADEGFSLRAILGSMVEGVAIVDPSLRIRLANDALQSMFELRQSPINRGVMEVFRDHEIQAALERSLREERAIAFESRTDARIDMGKPEKFFRVNVAPLVPGAAGGPAGLLVVIADVTEVRTLEAVRREFVANVSHEFRTPLAIITGYIETLLDGALDDPDMARKSLAVMQKHGRRLNLLIEDLLTISKLEHRSLPMNFRAADLEAAARRAADHLESAVLAADARVDFDFEPDARIADIDSTRIEQAFFNLLANAIQYGKKSGGRVAVRGRRKEDEIEISFEDDGPGIPYEDQPHIFERFYRVQKARTREMGGTGLGLSIVKNIVAAHGGHVALRSTPGAGSNFKIGIPIRQPEA